MKTAAFTAIACAFAIFGCSREPVLETKIPGLDLSRPQNSRYFHEHYDASKQFVSWCVNTMKEPIPKNDTSQMFYQNCRAATWAIRMPQKKLEGSRQYRSF